MSLLQNLKKLHKLHKFCNKLTTCQNFTSMSYIYFTSSYLSPLLSLSLSLSLSYFTLPSPFIFFSFSLSYFLLISLSCPRNVASHRCFTCSLPLSLHLLSLSQPIFSLSPIFLHFLSLSLPLFSSSFFLSLSLSTSLLSTSPFSLLFFSLSTVFGLTLLPTLFLSASSLSQEVCSPL